VLAAEADFGAGAPWRFNTNVPAADLRVLMRPCPCGAGAARRRRAASLHGIGRRRHRRRCARRACPSSPSTRTGRGYFDLHHTDNDTLDKIDPVALELNVEAYARRHRHGWPTARRSGSEEIGGPPARSARALPPSARGPSCGRPRSFEPSMAAL
jgi:hypothetical protein